MRPVLDWLNKHLADTELMMLFAFLVFVYLTLGMLGSILAPVLVAIALAYVMDGIVT